MPAEVVSGPTMGVLVCKILDLDPMFVRDIQISIPVNDVVVVTVQIILPECMLDPLMQIFEEYDYELKPKKEKKDELGRQDTEEISPPGATEGVSGGGD